MTITTVFFDLDDTLYPASLGLWEAIRVRMNDYMHKLFGLPDEELTALRQHYFMTYGTTLRGLQMNHQVDTEDFLAYVHDLPLNDYLKPDPALRALLLSLPKRRFVFTNSDANHANRVTNVLGVSDCFEGIIDIHSIEFFSKPNLEAVPARAAHRRGSRAGQLRLPGRLRAQPVACPADGLLHRAGG